MSVSHPHLRQSRGTCHRGRYEQLTKYQTISIFRYNIYYLLYISKNPNVYLELYIVIICNLTCNKFALLWGEAQLCLPYVCL